MPPVIAVRTYGLETTSPSRTMPNSFCGAWFLARRPVTSPNCLLPLDVNSMLTCHPAAPWVSKTAWAFLTSVPSISAGPRMNFCHWPCESLPQATVGWPGWTPSPVTARTALLVQSSAAYFAWSAAVAGSGAGLFGGDALAGADGLPLGVGVASALRASVTGRPCEVAVADGLGEADDEVAFSPGFEADGEGLPDVLADGLGLGVAGPPWTSRARTGRK
ncbi:hypothetical protein QFZ49_008148 [Streptomyces turgidiscabies]|uniref:Uncharacterized protein n=1 Tax=Streptomyces turgidiscabies TaxID=85558 RepID=A0ABU0S1T2_9ACTN|nr:hypothetical protein [Streptomyces turgidiscabies]